VENHGFAAFGYYRIVLGIVFIVYMLLSGSGSLIDAL